MVFAYWTRSIMDQKWHSAFGQKSTHQQFSCLGQKTIHQQFVRFWQKKTHQEFVRVGQRTHINNLWDLVSGATNSVCWPKIPDHIKYKEHKLHIFFFAYGFLDKLHTVCGFSMWFHADKRLSMCINCNAYAPLKKICMANSNVSTKYILLSRTFLPQAKRVIKTL